MFAVRSWFGRPPGGRRRTPVRASVSAAVVLAAAAMVPVAGPASPASACTFPPTPSPVGNPCSGWPGPTVSSATPLPPLPVCTLDVTVVAQWHQGYLVQVAIRRTDAAPVNNWAVTVRFPAGHRLTALWNGTATSIGDEVRVTRPAGLPAPAPGQAPAGFGFAASFPGGTFEPPQLRCEFAS